MADGEAAAAARRRTAISDYRKKLLNCRELESRVGTVRENLKIARKDYAKTEDDLKSLQSVGQIIGEVLRPLDNERFIVKASSGPRYVVGCRSKVDKEKLTSGTRVVLDMTTLTIMRTLPREAPSQYWPDPTTTHAPTPVPYEQRPLGGARPRRRVSRRRASPVAVAPPLNALHVLRRGIVIEQGWMLLKFQKVLIQKMLVE